MDVKIKEYPFPEHNVLVRSNFCVFPDELENDDLILFHGTLADNIDAILRDGFKSAERLGIGQLSTVSFSYKSNTALGHIANRDGECAILAVLYDDLNRPTIRRQGCEIYDSQLDPAPIVIGICRLPLDYKHLFRSNI